MKVIYIFILLLTMLSNCCSQEEKMNNTYEYLFVDEVPKFGTKEAKFRDFLYNNIKLPKNFSGNDRVLASFVIDEKGAVCDINVLKSYTNICKDAVIEVLSLMPKWIPGKLDGKFVRVRLYIELVFKIE